MKFLKTLFLLSLLIYLLTANLNAAPKRIFGREPKSEPSPFMVEEQTNLNRAAVERTEPDEDETGDEENSFSKRARGEKMPSIVETPFQATLEGQEGTSSSSSAAIMQRVAERHLRTREIPALSRFCLEKLMRLPATHSVFDNGLPLSLKGELITPYFNKISEMIQDVDKACQQYSLYDIPPNEKEKNELINLKKALEKHRGITQNLLLTTTKRHFPNALFKIDSITKVFPELVSSIEHLKEREVYNKEATLAQDSDQIGRASSLRNVAAPLNQQASLLFNIAVGKIKLQQRFLTDTPDAEIESSQKAIAALENQVMRTAPLLERQKIFLGRVGEFNPVKKSRLDLSFEVSHKVLKDLDAASAVGDKEIIAVLQQQWNAHDQIIKTLLSTDPRLQGIQENIISGNEKVASTASMILYIKAEQRRIASLRERRITTMKSAEEKIRSEAYAPIFDLYQLPSSFLEKEITLLQEGEVDSLAGRETLAVEKRVLAQGWHDLASTTATSVNVLSQIGMIVPLEEFLNQNETAVKEALVAREAELAAQPAMLPLDRTMASLPWDFSKTFEENVAALPPGEEDRGSEDVLKKLK